MKSLSILLVAPLLACAVQGDDDACVGMRRIALNRISLNRISLNKVALNGLLEQSLTSSTLGENFDAEMLRDPEMRDVFAYAVQCALTPDQSVEVTLDGEVQTFEGALGLASKWGEDGGACDEECRGWVSACLIARSNAKGESVPISLRGDHPGLLPTADELASYDTIEATYFGDVLAEPKRMHACLPEGVTEIPRVCGDSIDDCLVQVEGPCSDVCADGVCRASDGTVFAQSITVQRDTAACGG